MPDPGIPLTTPALTAEDTKLVTLARAARARTGAVEGAAVRDGEGRTYAAATVALPSLALTALQLAVASAVIIVPALTDLCDSLTRGVTDRWG